jgi:hypothetical protein
MFAVQQIAVADELTDDGEQDRRAAAPDRWIAVPLQIAPGLIA